MLYKKNVSQTLSDELFKAPTSEYRCTPFWAWNCKLDQELLDKEIDYMKEMGFGGFHMHVRTGLATPYLSEEYFDRIKGCVSKAKENKMLAWLYDEDRWPSGSAGGIVTKDYRYRARILTFTRRMPENAGTLDEARNEGKPYVLAVFDVVLDEDGYMTDYRVIDKNDSANGTKWFAVLITEGNSTWFNGQAYIDTLSKEAVNQFISVTHEKYYSEIGKDFNETVPAIFTDEPQFSRKSTLATPFSEGWIAFPWTFDFPDTFMTKYGYNIVEKLPELFQEPKDRISVARYNYHDHICDRFTEAFADNCGKWCTNHGISMTGHMMEEPTLCSQTSALGEAMRSYRNFGIPGIDMLCNWQELTTAKQTQSAVHQYGREGMLSELYGVTDWDFDFRGHKFQGDWQAALGVTVRVPHLFWASMAGEAKRDYPASIGYQSPWYKKYALVEDHFARVNTALTRGKPVVSVGVIHPIESYWLHFGPVSLTGELREQMDQHFKTFTDWMLSGLIDFDFISESLLPDQFGGIAEKELSVGVMKYKTVIVPEMQTMRRSTLEILRKFRTAGGQLIFVGNCPTLVDAEPSDEVKELFDASEKVPYDRIALMNSLKSVRLLSIEDQKHERFVYQLRQDNDCKWLFIAHLDQNKNRFMTRENNITLRIKGNYKPVLYDTLTGEIKDLSFRIEKDSTVISRTIYSQDSLLLKLLPEKEPQLSLPVETLTQTGIQLTRRKVPYRRSEPNVLLLDYAAYKIDDGEYYEEDEILRLDNNIRSKLGFDYRGGSIIQPWVFEPEVPQHKVTLKFTFESEIELEGALFAAEDIEKCRLTLNGENVTTDIAGYYVDESLKTVKLPKLVSGKNVIELELPFGRQTNTEWCYLLGEFNVRLEGCVKTIVQPTNMIAFQSVTTQGLPFYSGNIEYDVETDVPEDCNLFVKVGAFFGSVISVALDSKPVGDVAFEPYTLLIRNVSKGKHTLTFTLYGNRYNSHGGLHSTDYEMYWTGPNIWHTGDNRDNVGSIKVIGDNDISLNHYCADSWCDEYRVRDLGIITSPVVVFVK